MRRGMAVSLMLGCLTASAQQLITLDRIAVIAGGHAVKTSEVDGDVRATEFLNGEPLDLGPEPKRQSAGRLIDQQIIRNELKVGGYERPSDADAAALLKEIRGQRFGGSEPRMQQALSRYGLTEDQMRTRLLWQLTVLRFIDQRFRPGVLITDQDLHNYYDQHRAELEKQRPGATFEVLAPAIRDAMAAQQINEQFNSWLDQQRKDIRVQFIPGALE
jgi:peptidyl-prolyl cis-trans isomerase SurA